MKKSKLFFILCPVFITLSIVCLVADLVFLGAFSMVMIPVSLILGVVFLISEKRQRKAAAVPAPTLQPAPAPVPDPAPAPESEPAADPAPSFNPVFNVHFSVDGINLDDYDPDAPEIEIEKLNTDWDNAIKKMADFCVLDVETTGTNASFDRIVEISILKVVGNEIIDEYHTYVNPEMPISPGAFAVNHITDSMVQDAPKYEDIRQAVADLLLGATVVGHYVKFDLNFVEALIAPLGLSGRIRYFDTLPYARRVYPRLPNHKLQTLLAYLDIDPGQAHSASSDTRATFELFQRARADRAAQLQEEAAIKRDLKKKEEAARRAAYGASPLFNKRFVFCGNFDAGRSTITAMPETVGAIVQYKVVGNTNYVVQGVLSSPYDQEHLDAARRQQESGKKVQIITEAEFVAMIEAAREAMK